MTNRRALGLALVAVVMLLAAPTAEAQRRMAGRSLLLRIEGFKGPKPADMKPLPQASWKVNRGRDVYELHVTKLQVLSGDAAYFNVIERLEPYDPAFSIAGDRRALDAFVAAPLGQPLVILGYLRLDAAIRTLMMDTVYPAAPPEVTPSPAG